MDSGSHAAATMSAVEAWDMACRQTAKAWEGAGIHRLARMEVIERVRQVLMHGDAGAIADLVVEVSGNASLVAAAGGVDSIVDKRRGGIDASRVKVVASAVLEALIMPMLPVRADQSLFDLNRLKAACRHWVEHGALPVGACPPGPASDWLQEDLRNISDLMVAGAQVHEAAAIRLGALSMIVPALETLCLAMSLPQADGAADGACEGAGAQGIDGQGQGKEACHA
jgi:hypothetical protein